jgi:hypothetical protein
MKWILYIMLFVTPPANLTKKDEVSCLKMQSVKQIKEIEACRPKFESARLWSLQSTSTLEFSSFSACLIANDELESSVNVAATMAIRTWCICDSDKNLCPDSATLASLARDVRDCEKENPDSPQTCAVNKVRIATERDKPNANSSVLRIYPPAPRNR